MSVKVRELLDKRAKAVADMRDLLSKADQEKRDLTTDESAKYDQIFAEAENLKKAIEREERTAQLEAEIAVSKAVEPTAKKDEPKDAKERAFRSFLTRGLQRMSAEEIRALSTGSGADGGYLVAPMQFRNELIKAVDDRVFMRQYATVMQVVGAEGVGSPTLDADPSDADWTAEIKTGSEDSAMKFGRRELRPNPLAKRVKLSNKLIRQVPSIEGVVRDRLAYKFGISLEKGYLTGHGANQPLGVFTATGDGISTGRDVSTGNTQTSVTRDGVIEAKFALKEAYWPRARWIISRTFLKQLVKERESTGGAYLWQPSQVVGQPDTLLGFPYHVSEYVPATFTSGLYVGILGDFSYYHIADALDLQMQVLDQLYAETNQTGYIGRLESDGMPVLEEAFVRVKLA